MKFFHKTFSIFFVLALVFGGAFSASAWQDPVGGFPAGNVPAPINTGSSDQVKAGGGIGAEFFAGKSGLFANVFTCGSFLGQQVCPTGPNILEALAVSDLGNIAGTILKGLTVTRSGGLRIVDGNQAAGKVLTSDASGNATWQPSSGGTGSATLPPGTVNQTLRHNGTDWEATSGLLSTGASAAVVGTGGSLKLISPNQSHAFIEWFTGGSGSNSTWSTNLSGTAITRGGWAGFGGSGSKILTIANEYGAGTANGSIGAPGSIALDPGQNGAIGINSPNQEPDSSFGTALDVAGKVRIRGGNPNEGDVLTVVNPAGTAAGDDDGYAEWRPMPDIKMVYKTDHMDGDGSSLSASCPSGYAAIAISCDSSHDAGADECKLTPEPSFIDNDGGRTYNTPADFPFSGGRMSSVANKTSDNSITLTCLRVFVPSSGGGTGSAFSATTITGNCINGQYIFTTNPTGGTTPYTYSWRNVTTGSTNTTSSFHTALPSGGTVRVTVTDASGASDTVQQTFGACN